MTYAGAFMDRKRFTDTDYTDYTDAITILTNYNNYFNLRRRSAQLSGISLQLYRQ